ncbi:MAG: GatB/YqeY domain-containing protein [Leptospiraceae bacterium]|nr:GatB/YqeY domain-containing protein [Leptospiraceae bacterium]
MASLQEQIDADLKTALKSKARTELAALRLLKADIQHELTKDGSAEIADEQVQAIIKRAVKRRKDSIEQFTKAGSLDNAEQEKAELVFIERYLPAGLDEAAIKIHVSAVLESIKPAGPQDTGKVMGAVMGRLKGQNADGAIVKQVVSGMLAQLN